MRPDTSEGLITAHGYGMTVVYHQDSHGGIEDILDVKCGDPVAAFHVISDLSPAYRDELALAHGHRAASTVIDAVRDWRAGTLADDWYDAAGADYDDVVAAICSAFEIFVEPSDLEED